ncbi:MAG: cation:proton antiporter [Candidatus Dojkabacteria bacterium]
MDLIAQLALIILVGVVSGIIALKLKSPLMVGYIMGGAVLSQLVSHDSFDFEAIENLGEVGIALLLFVIGIEFSISKLYELRKFAIYGGVVQIIMTIVFGLLVFPLFGFGSYESLFLGAVFALSSTAVVIKVLDDLGQIETHASQIIIGWLILQDIAVVVLIILLGNFATGSVDFAGLFESLLKAVILIASAVVVGRSVIPRILTSISRLGSTEIMLVTALSLSLAFSFLAEEFGVSYTLGAFLAGVMISDSFIQHEIFSEIKPLQNTFAMFFFIVIGTLFSFDYLVGNVFKVLLVLGAILLGKFLIILVINLILKMHIRNAVEVAIGLAQVGEFAFLSSQIGLDNGWIGSDLNNLIVSVTILSLLVTPFLIMKSDPIYEKIRDFFGYRYPTIHRKIFMAPDNDVKISNSRKNHMIVVGYGRVGRYVALALRRMHYKLVVVDIDSDTAEEARKTGIDTIYGDATSEEILLQAGVKEAKAVIVALPKEAEVLTIASKVETVNPGSQIVIRRHTFGEDIKGGKNYSFIEPEFEAAVRIIEKMLKIMGKRDKSVLKWLRSQQDLLDISGK